MVLEYRDMVLGADRVPLRYNLMAAFSTWILLAGYMVLPGIFKSLDLPMLQDHNLLVGNQQNAILSIAGVCGLAGLIGIVYLWHRWCDNYIWLIGRLFLSVPQPAHCNTNRG